MLLLTLILYLMPIGSIKAQNLYNQPPGSIVPSEQTAQNFAKAPSEAERPNLRQGPGEEGSAQKEVDANLTEPSNYMLLILLLSCGVYGLMNIKCIKTRKL